MSSLFDNHLGTDSQRSAHIRAAVVQAETTLRQRHPWLAHQDAIGMAILIFAWAGMVGSSLAYGAGWIGASLCIPLVALFASLTHELEHDLIHWMYFRRRPWAHHLMMALVWVARPSTVNPWLRRKLHFNHHKHSGTETDIEERAITNGERWTFARFLMTADAGASVLMRLSRVPDARSRLRLLVRALVAYFPLGWIHWSLWWGFLAIALANAISVTVSGVAPVWPPAMQAVLPTLQFLIVVWIAPNVLRSFCLHFISSNMHYYGDIEDGNLMQQTQVLTAWRLWPLQLFCFNFGGTHAIHHFVVGQPFYIRQWIAPAAYRAMREAGVRFDDLGAFARANRWSVEAFGRS